MDSFTSVIQIFVKVLCKCHDVSQKKKKPNPSQKTHFRGISVSNKAVDTSRMFHNVRRKRCIERTFLNFSWKERVELLE